MDQGTVTVIILSWNSKPHLGACLDSVRAQTYPNKEVLVIENGSRDGSAEFVRGRYPEVRLMVQETNQGFARGNNLGIDQSRGEFVMTLNSDVVLRPDYLERLIGELANNPGLGMVCGKLFRPDGKTLDSTGLILTRARRFRDRGSEEEDRSQYDGSRDIFGVCAAAAIFRRRTLEDIRTGSEYFDEDFFAYVEDVDLAWRARRLGWTAAFVPAAAGTHIRGGSNLHLKTKQALSFRNRYWMILKNDTPLHLLLDFPLLAVYDLPRFVYLCLTNVRTIPEMIRCLIGIPKMLKKRRPARVDAADLRRWIAEGGAR